MATWRIKSVYRPPVQNTGSGDFEDADYLRTHIISDEDQEQVLVMPFADHAGLQTEWEAGTATTVLDAAIDSLIGTDVYTADDELASGTRSGKEGYTFTE